MTNIEELEKELNGSKMTLLQIYEFMENKGLDDSYKDNYSRDKDANDTLDEKEAIFFLEDGETCIFVCFDVLQYDNENPMNSLVHIYCLLDEE